MQTKVRVLGIQTEPKVNDRHYNISKVEEILETYAWYKADLVVLSEVFLTGIVSPEQFKAASVKIPSDTTDLFSSWAKKYNFHLVAGSVIEECPDGKCRNNSILFSPAGKILANYYKLHMFSYYGSREGEFSNPGDETVIAKTSIGNIGLTVCYDLRFPELYRSLSYNGAEIITVPAAWPYPRLEHWVTLNRARAIENQCFIVSVNQVGKVPPVRVNVGHSMIIDPWGSVIASAGEKEGVMLAEIDLNQVYKLREEFPILKDRNLDAYANLKILG